MTEKTDTVAFEKRKLSQKLVQLKQINADMKAELVDFHKVENDLNIANDELA